MNETITYSDARAQFATLIARVIADRTPVTISRRGFEDVILISASEYAGLVETAHLLRSPKNAERLFEALDRTRSGKGETMTLDELRERVGLSQE